jgi:hypothetical protein
MQWYRLQASSTSAEPPILYRRIRPIVGELPKGTYRVSSDDERVEKCADLGQCLMQPKALSPSRSSHARAWSHGLGYGWHCRSVP